MVVAPALAEQGTAGIPLPPPPPPGSGDVDPGAGSPSGYPGASEAQAENLFTANFSETVDSLATDPVDLSGEHPVYLNDHLALVSSDGTPDLTDEIRAILDRNKHDPEAAQAELDALLDDQAAGGEEATQLVSSTAPLRASSGGDEAPVDLALEQNGAGYEPDNPLVDLRLPEDLGGEVAVGDQGIGLELDGGESADADPMSGDNLFYANAAPATDVVLAPISTGVETFYQLRAPESPDRFRIDFSLPAGAQLTETADGGAAILRDGEPIASVYPPSAHDASGERVDVSMSVAGDSLFLDVPHADPGIRYPISVDPVIDTYTWSTNGAGSFSHWVQNKTVGSPYQLRTTCLQNVTCSSGTSGPVGLYSLAPASQAVAAQSTGAWQYSVPHFPSTSAFISSVGLGPMTFNTRTDSATNPFMFAGIYNHSSGTYLDSQSQNTSASNLNWSLNVGLGQTGGKKAVFSLWSFVARTVTAWRSAYLGGATVTLGDTESPTLSMTHSGISYDPATGYSNWVDNATPTITANATDGGLGIKRFQFDIPYTSGSGDRTVNLWCTGSNASPCGQSASSGAIPYDTGQMPNGVTVIGVTATDALDKADARIRSVRVDHSPPTVDITGGLSQSPSGTPYALHVDARDGNAYAGSAQWQSGVKRVSVFVNDNLVADTGALACTPNAGSCARSLDTTIGSQDYTTRPLHMKVVATDQFGAVPGHMTIREWDVPIPETLIDSGPSGPTNDATPSFTYHSSLAGSTFQCRIDNASFTSCPASGYTVPSSLSDGGHTFEVRAIDSAGHVDPTPANPTFTVDTQAPPVSVTSGPSGLTFDARPIFGFSSTDGSATFLCSIDTGTPNFGNCSGSGTHRPSEELGNGSYTFRVRATDPAGNLSTATRTFQLSNPTLDVSGPLVDGENPLVGSDPITDFIATDTGSGVTSVKLLVDSQVQEEVPQDCPGGGCSLEGSLEPDLSELTPGSHTYKVVASNANGIAKHVSGNFRLDPGGPTLELTGALADANGQPLATATAGLVIRAIDNAPGDTGIANVEVAVDDDPAATANPSCGQSCPADYTTSYTYRKVDWGPGAHTVTVTTTDAAGNASETTLDVDGTVEDSVTCPTVSQTVQDPVNVVSTATAQAQAPAAALAPTQPTTDPEDPEAEAIDPSLSEPAQAPTPLSSTDTLASDEVASLPANGFKVNNSICLVPTQTTPAETNATVVAGDSALYANSAQETDTIVRPTAAGEAVIASRRGPSAPTGFSWQVGLPSGMQLQQLSSGAVAIIDPAQPASLPPPTSGPPAGSQSPSTIADAATQLAAERYWVAAAQQETGKYVDAVIRPPFAINAQGQSAPATLAISAPNRITLNVPSGSAAGVMAVDSNDQQAKKDRAITYSWGGDPGDTTEECAQGRAAAGEGRHAEGKGVAQLRRLTAFGVYPPRCNAPKYVPPGTLKARYEYKVRYNGSWHPCGESGWKANAHEDWKVRASTGHFTSAPCGDHHYYRTMGFFKVKKGNGSGLKFALGSPKKWIRGR